MTEPRPLVLLHGAGQSPVTWQDVITHVALGGGPRKIKAPWLSGLKPTDDGDFDIDRAAADCARAIEFEGWAPATVCGQDLGAMIAMRVAAQYPQMVHQLVLVAPEVAPPASVLRAQRWAVRLMPTSRLAAKGVSKEKLLSVLSSMASLDLHGDLAAITCPVVVALGRGDKADDPGLHRLADSLADVHMRRVDGAGRLNADAPEPLAALLLDVTTTAEGSEDPSDN